MNDSRYKVYDTSAYEGKNVHVLLAEFHSKFGLAYDGPPRVLSSAELAFRLTCHAEEAAEYCASDNIVDDLDSLVDEVYFLAGTAHRMGLQMQALQFVGDKCPYDGPPRRLSDSDRDRRISMHESALGRLASILQREKVGDPYHALACALYEFTYTAALQGFTGFEEAIRRVHAANMVKDVDPAKQRRRAELKAQGHDVEHMMEITKPDDWLPPYLGDLCGLGPYNDRAFTQRVLLLGGGEGKEVLPTQLCGLVTIDGPDASGKTTLAQRLAEITGGEYIHLTWTPRLAEVMDDYRMGALAYACALAHDRVVVLERPWLSHVVYSDVYRGGVKHPNEVQGWKATTEEHANVNIIGLPGDEKRWLELYTRMCQEREELHGPDLIRAGQVRAEFARHFQDGNSCWFPVNAISYDMFMLSDHSVDIDAYLADFVLPLLNYKG